MNTNTTAPAGVVSSTELGLLPISPHDHPEPRTMMWSALEIAAIKEYAARCVVAERERWMTSVRDVRGDWDHYDNVTADEIQKRALQPNTEVDRASGSGRTQS